MKTIKYIIAIATLFCLVIVGIIIFNDRTVTTITLDINPSIQINLGVNKKVKSVKALNKDAKMIVTNDLNGKTLDNALNIITDNLIQNGYARYDDKIEVLIYSKGDVSSDSVKEILGEVFIEKQINSEIIVIDEVSSEDQKLSKKYGITEAKAAYINSIIKDKEEIDFEVLTDKPVNELTETKQTGKYCNLGYNLEGDFCIKEVAREKASFGEICPNGYYEYNSTCYEEIRPLFGEEYECPTGLTLTSDNRCVGKEYVEANANFSCENGDLIKRGFAKYNKFRDSGDWEQYVCEDKSNAIAPTQRCLTINHTMINGKCAVGPAPVINGGCPNGDSLINGGCYSIDPEDQWVCPDGGIYEKSKGSYTELCPDTFKYTIAVGSYSCEEGYTLEGNKCSKEREEQAINKPHCPSGYSLVDNDRCINYSNIKSKIDGNICNKENSRLDKDDCIILDIVEANHN